MPPVGLAVEHPDRAVGIGQAVVARALREGDRAVARASCPWSRPSPRRWAAPSSPGLRTRMRIVVGLGDRLLGRERRLGDVDAEACPRARWRPALAAAAAGERPRARRRSARWTVGPSRRARTYHRPDRAEVHATRRGRRTRRFRFGERDRAWHKVHACLTRGHRGLRAMRGERTVGPKRRRSSVPAGEEPAGRGGRHDDPHGEDDHVGAAARRTRTAASSSRSSCSR